MLSASRSFAVSKRKSTADTAIRGAAMNESFKSTILFFRESTAAVKRKINAAINLPPSGSRILSAKPANTSRQCAPLRRA